MNAFQSAQWNEMQKKKLKIKLKKTWITFKDGLHLLLTHIQLLMLKIKLADWFWLKKSSKKKKKTVGWMLLSFQCDTLACPNENWSCLCIIYSLFFSTEWFSFKICIFFSVSSTEFHIQLLGRRKKKQKQKLPTPSLWFSCKRHNKSQQDKKTCLSFFL